MTSSLEAANDVVSKIMCSKYYTDPTTQKKNEALNDILQIDSIIVTLKMVIKKYILNKLSASQLEKIWSELPAQLREETYPKLPCYEHYNLEGDTTHIDGPPLPKYLCYMCNNIENV